MEFNQLDQKGKWSYLLRESFIENQRIKGNANIDHTYATAPQKSFASKNYWWLLNECEISHIYFLSIY